MIQVTWQEVEFSAPALTRKGWDNASGFIQSGYAALIIDNEFLTIDGEYLVVPEE